MSINTLNYWGGDGPESAEELEDESLNVGQGSI